MTSAKKRRNFATTKDEKTTQQTYLKTFKNSKVMKTVNLFTANLEGRALIQEKAATRKATAAALANFAASIDAEFTKVIKDKTGHVWFIEIHPRYNKSHNGDDRLGFYGEVYDVSWNDQAMKDYTERYDAMMKKYGSWWKAPTNERPALPMTKYERIESKELFTYASVLAWVNRRFKTDYKEMFLDRYFLNCDDVISEC